MLSVSVFLVVSTAAPVEAATVPTIGSTANINPQFPEGEIKTSTVNDTTIQQSLDRRGSLPLPSPESQKTVDEVWYEMQKLHEEQGHGSTSGFQEVNSFMRQATDEVMNLEDFLIRAGVVRSHDNSPLQQSCVPYPNNNNAADRSSGPTAKVVSRKQRRMIKNRESAARSRARRQVWSVFSEINLS